MTGLIDTRRRRYRHGNLPNALRAAARAILDEDGPDVVGLRETARRVGVSATAAYRHFSNKEDLLASVAAEGFRELAVAMETGATESDALHAVGLAYVEFALQKRGLFRLMFGPVLVQRAKYPELDDSASAVFGLLQRAAAGVDEGPREDNSAGMAAWGLVHGLSSLLSTASSPRRTQEEWRIRFSSKGPDLKATPPPSGDGPTSTLGARTRQSRRGSRFRLGDLRARLRRAFRRSRASPTYDGRRGSLHKAGMAHGCALPMLRSDRRLRIRPPEQ